MSAIKGFSTKIKIIIQPEIACNSFFLVFFVHAAIANLESDIDKAEFNPDLF